MKSITNINANNSTRKSLNELSSYEKFKKIKQDLNKNSSQFIDDLFPPHLSSLISNPKNSGVLYLEYNNWKRIFEKNLKLYDDSPSFNDIDIDNNCLTCQNLIIALQIISRKKELIERIFENQIANQEGIYFVRFNIDGTPTYIIIDDFFPIDQKGDFVFLKIKNNKVWPLVIEKSLAKVFGSFENISFGSLLDILNILTDSAYKKIYFHDPNFNEKIKKLFLNDFIIIGNALIENIAKKYLLTNLKDDQIDFLELPSRIPKTIKISELSNMFNFLYFFELNKINSHYENLRMNSTAVSIRKLTIKDAGPLSISVTQKDLKNFNRGAKFLTKLEENKTIIDYYPTRLFLFYKAEIQKNYEFVDGILDVGKIVSFNLEKAQPGIYYILTNIDWGKAIFDSVLKLETEENLDVSEINFKSNKEEIIKMLQIMNWIDLEQATVKQIQIKIMLNLDFGLFSICIQNKSEKSINLEDNLINLNPEKFCLFELHDKNEILPLSDFLSFGKIIAELDKEKIEEIEKDLKNLINIFKDSFF